MSNIINLEKFIANKNFNSKVIPFFKNLNPSFKYFEQEFETAFVLNTSFNLVVFVKYVPRNKFTDLPTIEDSFNDIKTNPRKSSGEWVVSNIYEIPVEKLFDLMKEISNTSSPVEFLKEKISQ